MSRRRRPQAARSQKFSKSSALQQHTSSPATLWYRDFDIGLQGGLAGAGEIKKKNLLEELVHSLVAQPEAVKTVCVALSVSDSGGHVLRETTSRGLCGLVCPWGEGDCVKEGGEGEGERERERALGPRRLWFGVCCCLLLQYLIQSCARGGRLSPSRCVCAPLLHPLLLSHNLPLPRIH
jgi:hypothetical protein